MIPLNYILTKDTGGYKFIKSQEMINHLMYMNDIKTLIQTIRIYSKDIGIELSIEKCAILIMKRRKIGIIEGIKMPYQ